MIETCPVCEGPVTHVREVRDVTVGRRTVAVEHELYHCAACGEDFFEPQAMDDVLRRAAEKVRELEGTLAPAEIVALRRGLGYTQAELEAILNSGAKTVTRWERGTVAPTGSTDTLLRVFLRHPEIAHELANERGIRPGAPSRRKAG
jgi:HTH-type transcriptional regulator/antitoxin MqsA